MKKEFLLINPCNQKGFTLHEMLVVLIIMAIGAAMASPHVADIRNVINKNTAENQILQDLRWLQAKAVEQGCRGILLTTNTNRSYEMGCDYVPFQTDPTTLSIETIFSEHHLPANITMSFSDPLIYNTRGQSINADGSLQETGLTLFLSGSEFKTGTVKATGFFEFND